MYQVVKRDGKIVEFDINKIAAAIKKAFDATGTDYNDSVIDFLALKVTADFQPKIKDGKVAVEDIQDSVEAVLSRGGYEAVAKSYILYRKQREKLRNTQVLLPRLQGDCGQVPQHRGLARQRKLHRHLFRRRTYPLELRRHHRELLAQRSIRSTRSLTRTATADIHLHDLSMLTGYCAGWSLQASSSRQGLAACPGKINSSPASHLSTLCNQMVNFLGIMQNEWAGAQAFSSLRHVSGSVRESR